MFDASGEPRPIPSPPDRAIYTPHGGPPATGGIDRGLYERMGEPAIRRLTDDFYGRLARSSVVGRMFPADPKELVEAAGRTADFFVFLFGGPPLYQQRWGRPMMRARHLPFVIDEAARAEWVRCFEGAAEEAVTRGDWSAQDRDGVVAFLAAFSGWMVNSGP
ncbi:MAG: hypothetical protein AAGB51_01915 [Planctomycetota bacterium]